MSSSDELCVSCAKVDLYSLFTGPRYFPGDGYKDRVIVKLGTLEEVKSNSRCPCCRMIKHDLYGSGLSHPWEYYGDDEDPSKVRCVVTPVRSDYGEEMRYVNDKTGDMIATKLEVHLLALGNCTIGESDKIRPHHRGPGIQLLSPHSVDPARPLHNGFRATTMENSLALLAKCIKTCREYHQDTCHLDELPTFHPAASRLVKFPVIDVVERKLVECDLTVIRYAALSYVWGKEQAAYEKLSVQLTVEKDIFGQTTVNLPTVVPKVIEDAMYACKALSIPYMWVDLYCIHQHDPIRKAAEMDAMGHVYRCAEITLIAGCPTFAGGKGNSQDQEPGLIPAPGARDIGATQRIETIGDWQYVSALPPTMRQIQASEWHRRSWTMQEGALATRVAFFGRHDVSFMCGAGHWREALHSGTYGHETKMPNLDLRSEGYYILSGYSWLNTSEWKFKDYNSIIMTYTGRNITLESDKLNAIAGCLKIIAKKKETQFLSGLPSKDFHYALLWMGEYDRPREGFPSWSWAGWHALQQMYNIFPENGSSGALVQSENGYLENQLPETHEIELQGLLISLMERPHLHNRCKQQLAHISMSNPSADIIIISSESAFFFIDILPDPVKPTAQSRKRSYNTIPLDFDSTVSPEAIWDLDVEYKTPPNRFRLRDSFGNTYTHYYPYWYDHWPHLKLTFPRTLRGSTLAWLLRDGIQLIKIVGIELLEGAERLKTLNHVLCLGIDSSEGVPGRGRRMGMFYLPREIWDKAQPRKTTVELW